MDRKILWLIAILCFCSISFFGLYTGTQRISDFAAYYTPAKILVTTDSVSHIYNEEWFKEKVNSYGIPDSTVIMYVNPPAVSIVMAPLVWMKPPIAKIVWNMLNIVFLVVAIHLLRHLLKIPFDSIQTPILVLVLSCSLPFLRNLQRGQMYVFMLVCLIVLAHGYTERKPVLASVPLAALLLLKYFGWMFLILFIIERRWREVLMTFVFVMVGSLLGVFFFGIDTYRASLEALWSAQNHSDFAFTGLPSLPALFGSLFTFHPLWNPNPLSDTPWVSSILVGATMVVMLVSVFKTSGLSSPSLQRFSLIAILSVIFTPLAADHHYLLLALPICVYIFRTDFLIKNYLSLSATIVVVVAITGWYPQPAMKALVGWEKLVAFPRLYGAIALWFMLLIHYRSANNRTSVLPAA